MIARFEMPTWDEVYTMLLSQAKRIREDCFEADVILGVSRGGLVSARILSDLLENPNLAIVRTECYLNIGESKSEPTLKEPLSVSVDGKNVLVVDDIADSGRSLELVKAHVVERGAGLVKTATLFRKPWSILKPEYFEKETKLWVVFPWDLKETIRKAFEKRGNTTLSQLGENLKDASLPNALVQRFLRELSEERLC